VVNDSADVTSAERSFHVCGPATGKAQLPTVDSLLVGTTRGLVPTELSDRRLGCSRQGISQQSRKVFLVTLALRPVAYCEIRLK